MDDGGRQYARVVNSLPDRSEFAARVPDDPFVSKHRPSSSRKIPSLASARISRYSESASVEVALASSSTLLLPSVKWSAICSSAAVLAMS